MSENIWWSQITSSVLAKQDRILAKSSRQWPKILVCNRCLKWWREGKGRGQLRFGVLLYFGLMWWPTRQMLSCQYSTVQYSTVQYSTVQYSTAQLQSPRHLVLQSAVQCSSIVIIGAQVRGVKEEKEEEEEKKLPYCWLMLLCLVGVSKNT